MEREGQLALVDLAGQVVGLRSTTPEGFTIRDRFNEPFCTATRGPRGFLLRAQDTPLEAAETAEGIRVRGPGLDRALTADGVAAAGLGVAARPGGFDVLREAETVFSVDGPLDPRAALALALGELEFPKRVCLALVVDELD